MKSYYDSSRVILERLVSADPDDPWNRTELGLTYAGLGREQEALREGQLAVKLLPVSEDATSGTEFERNLANIHCIIGNYDQAIERLDYLLSIPSKVSVPFLKIWPDYAPLRDLPQFKALLKKYEGKHGT
jgi:tetratricopeptide (TPR) repeat protein